MEPKKKTKGDLESRKNSFLLIGLVIVLSLVYASFELFATKDNVKSGQTSDDLFDQFDEKTINTDIKTPPPTPPVRQNVEKVIEIVDDFTKTTYTGPLFPEFNPDEIIEDIQEIKIIQPEPDELITSFVDEMPEFPGGTEGLNSYLRREVRYPEVCRQIGISGTVLVQFVVEKDGSISNVKTLVSVYPDLDAEAMRVIAGFPKWKPGKKMNQLMRVYYQVPITFSLM